MRQCLVKEVPNITVKVAWSCIQQCTVRHIGSVAMRYSSRERVFIVQIFLKDPVFHEILPVGAEPLHADLGTDRRTDRQTEVKKLTVAFSYFSKASNTICGAN